MNQSIAESIDAFEMIESVATASASPAELLAAGHLLRAAVAAGARHRRGGARRRAGPRAAAGAGAREGRVGSEERGVPECCGALRSRDQVWTVT